MAAFSLFFISKTISPVNHAPGALLRFFFHLFQVLNRIPVLIAVDFAVARTTQPQAVVWRTTFSLGLARVISRTTSGGSCLVSCIADRKRLTLLIGTSRKSQAQRTMMAGTVRQVALCLR